MLASEASLFSDHCLSKPRKVQPVAYSFKCFPLRCENINTSAHQHLNTLRDARRDELPPAVTPLANEEATYVLSVLLLVKCRV